MLNAAVRRNQVEAGGSFESAFTAVRAVRNFYSEADPALRAFKKRKLGQTALGTGAYGEGVSPLIRGRYQDLNMMDPAVAGSPVCEHSTHLKPAEWKAQTTGRRECRGSGDYGELFRTIAQEMKEVER